MSTELEVLHDIGTEQAAPQQLSVNEAKALDKKIRTASDKVTASIETLLDLLEQAAAGQIHLALGLKSWTAWFKDAVQIQVSTKVERREFVKLMTGAGMSQRAIASTLGVSKGTVQADQGGQSCPPWDEPVTAGLDGKAYRRPSKDDVDFEEPTRTAKAVAAAFETEVANLYNAASELSELLAEPNWSAVRPRTADYIDNLRRGIALAKIVLDAL